jgi:hypothetical protein
MIPTPLDHSAVALAQARRRRLRSHTKATTARTAASASRPVDASISGTLVTVPPPGTPSPTESGVVPEVDKEPDDDPP